MQRTHHRRKILYVPEHLVIGAIFPSPHEIAYQIVQPTLPEDAVVLGVYYEATRAGFEFVIESETFEPVPLGQRCPELPAIEWKYLK